MPNISQEQKALYDQKSEKYRANYTLEEFVELNEMAQAAVRALNAGVLRDEAEAAARKATPHTPSRGNSKQSNEQQTP